MDNYDNLTIADIKDIREHVRSNMIAKHFHENVEAMAKKYCITTKQVLQIFRGDL